MPDVTRQVETEFTMADRVTAPLRNMHATATRVTVAFDRATKTISRYGTFAASAAGVYGVASTLMGAQRYLATVRDINAATGFQTEQVDAVLEVMDRANISAMEGSQIIQKMSISMQRYKMEVQRTGKAQSDASRIIEKLGVNLEKGPQAAMVQMAQLAKAGKLSMADLNIAFQVSETSAIRLQALLKRGPEEVGRIMTELQNQGLAINAANIAAFNRYEEAVIRIRSAWNRIAIVVSAKVMPVVAQLLEKVRDRIESWTANADEWGEKIAGWLEKHYRKIILIGKVMAVNAALQATMGVGLGRITAGGMGMAGRVGGRVFGREGAITGAVERLGSRLLGREAAAVGVVERLGGRLLGREVAVAGIMGRIGGQLLGGAAVAGGGAAAAVGGGAAVGGAALATSIGSLVAALAPLAAIVAALAAVAAVVIAGVTAIRENFNGVADTIQGLWDQLMAQFDVIAASFGPLISVIESVVGPLGSLFTREGPVGKFFMLLLPNAIILYLKYVNAFLITVRAIPVFFVKIWDAFNSIVLQPILEGWVWVFTQFVAYVRDPIIKAWQTVSELFDQFVAYVRDPIIKAWQIVSELFDTYVLAPILNAWGDVRSSFGGVRNSIITGLNDILNWLSKKLGPLFSTMSLPLNLWKESVADIKASTAEALALRKQARLLKIPEPTPPLPYIPRVPPPERPPPTVNDFRGSKFDIKQTFAEGFDPDRIAVAFSSDLADLGEKRVQSGLSPLFAVR